MITRQPNYPLIFPCPPPKPAILQKKSTFLHFLLAKVPAVVYTHAVPTREPHHRAGY